MSSSNVIVAGIFYDHKLIEVPRIRPINDIDDIEEYKAVVKDIYFDFIESNLFKNFLQRGVVISFGDVYEELVVEKSPSVKCCGIFNHYALVFSFNFHRPYIWTDSFNCKQELTNWSYVTVHPDDNDEKYFQIQQYVHQYGRMIKNATKDSITYENFTVKASQELN